MRNQKATSFAGLALALLFMNMLTACSPDKKLPILGPREVSLSKDAEGKDKIDTIYKTIPNFRFLNQDSVFFDQNTFKDKIYVADFFFTSCSTICPVMHRNLFNLYEAYKNNDKVMFLSHTIDFKYDTPSKLKRYAQKLGVDDKKWVFAYGEKEKIYQIAEKDYLVAVKEDKDAKDGYIHQGWLLLIDQHRRIRGAYDGTQSADVAKLKEDIAVLLAENN